MEMGLWSSLLRLDLSSKQIAIANISVWILVETFLAPCRAEAIALSLIRTGPLGSLVIHFHNAYRIFRHGTYLLVPICEDRFPRNQNPDPSQALSIEDQ